MDYIVCNIPVVYTSKQMQEFGVYAIKNKLNSKLYIGSTTNNFRERWGEHIRMLRQNKHSNKHLQNSWNLSYENDFEFLILESILNKDEILIYEQRYIDKYNYTELYNVCKIAGNTLGTKQPQQAVLRKSKDWVFVSPDNEVFHITNMRLFCREHNLPQSHMINIANRKSRQYKGWLVYKKEEFNLDLLNNDRKRITHKQFKLTNQFGEVYITNRLQTFANQNNLSSSCLLNTLCGQGGRKQHKGWTIQQVN